MPNTDFSQLNVQEILKHSLPKRFQDMDPYDFEDFIAFLFSKMGYTIQPTSYSGDFGADLIVEKDNKKIAVQVKRYEKNNKVNVASVNQVIGAKNYYNCDTALIITTSDYTKPAYDLMNATETKCWNWNDLQKRISDIFLNGEDVYNVLKNNENNVDEQFSFKIDKISYKVDMKKIGSCTLVFANLKNNAHNAGVAIGLPTYISTTNNQVEAIYWYEGYFSGGTIYSGATTQIAFMFKSQQVPRVSDGDRFILPIEDEKGVQFLEAQKTSGASEEKPSDKAIGCLLVALFFVLVIIMISKA